jgi:hypothetical protein
VHLKNLERHILAVTGKVLVNQQMKEVKAVFTALPKVQSEIAAIFLNSSSNRRS